MAGRPAHLQRTIKTKMKDGTGTMKKLFGLGLATMMLSGCAMVPGMNFDPSSYETYGTEDFPDTESGETFRVTQITPSVLEKLRASAKPTQSNTGLQQLARDMTSYEYRVGPQDVLTIIVWDHPELTIPAGEFRNPEDAGTLVDRDGTIFYPYVGVVHVAGKTVSEIRDLLTDRIAAYVTKPQLGVRVAAFRSQRVNIVGEVIKPSIQAITDVPLTALEAINQAGGVTPESDLTRVRLTRGNHERSLNLQALYDSGDLSQNVVLQHGDVLHVPDRNDNKVYVLGEVGKPDALLMHKSEMNLAEAIGHTGGFDRVSSDPSRLYVIRGENSKPVVYQLNAESPDALLLATQFALKPQDVVYVSSTSLTRWNRVMTQILPTIQGLWQTKVLIDN